MNRNAWRKNTITRKYWTRLVNFRPQNPRVPRVVVFELFLKLLQYHRQHEQDYQTFLAKSRKEQNLYKNKVNRRLSHLEEQLTATTEKLNRANQKLAEHQHDNTQPMSGSVNVIDRRLDEAQRRIKILELSDQEMDNDIQRLQEKIDLVENLDRKTDLISKVNS